MIKRCRESWQTTNAYKLKFHGTDTDTETDTDTDFLADFRARILARKSACPARATRSARQLVGRLLSDTRFSSREIPRKSVEDARVYTCTCTGMINYRVHVYKITR